MFPEDNIVDEIVDVGDPWHGLYKNGTINLPNGGTRALIGAVPLRGDTFVVRVPDQPEATTTSAETAQGKEWFNYGLIAGENHVMYGAELGGLSWIYIAPDKSAWLATYANATGNITLKRFGVFDGTTASVEQTLTIDTMDPNYRTIIQDITETGNQIILSSETISTAEPCSRAHIVFPMLVKMLTISGTPPAASVSATDLATASQCRGTRTNTRMKHTQYTYWSASPQPDDDRPDSDPNHFFVLGTEASGVHTYSTPTDSPVTDPGPELGGRILIQTGQGYRDPATGSLASWSMPAGPVSSITYDGAKTISGAVIGATFSGGADPLLVTVDATLTDSVSNLSLFPVTRSRAGSMTIKIGATEIYTLPFTWSATSVSDAGYTALNLNLANLITDTDASHAASMVGGAGISPIELYYDSQHLVMSGPAPYGAEYQGPLCTRFIPHRYSNNTYGFVHIQGGGWHLYASEINPWWEQLGTINETHHVKSAFGGSESTLSVTGAGGSDLGYGIARLVFASCQPQKNTVALFDYPISYK